MFALQFGCFALPKQKSAMAHKHTNYSPDPNLAEPIGATDYVLGTHHARVIVVKYGDFECPNCKQAAPVVKILLNRFARDVRFTFRHFPLEEVHPHARQAAVATEYAGANDVMRRPKRRIGGLCG